MGRCDEKGDVIGILQKKLEMCTLQALELQEVNCGKGSRLGSGINKVICSKPCIGV